MAILGVELHPAVVAEDHVVVGHAGQRLLAAVGGVLEAEDGVPAAAAENVIAAVVARDDVVAVVVEVRHGLDGLEAPRVQLDAAAVADDHVLPGGTRPENRGRRIEIAPDRVVAAAAEDDVVAIAAGDEVIAIGDQRDSRVQVGRGHRVVVPRKIAGGDQRRLVGIADQLVIAERVGADARAGLVRRQQARGVAHEQVDHQAVVAKHQVGASAGVDCVIARAAEDDVGSGFVVVGLLRGAEPWPLQEAGADDVVTLVTEDDVRTPVAVDAICAALAADKVVAIAALDVVAAVGRGRDHVVRIIRIEREIGRAERVAIAEDDVVALVAEQPVRAGAAIDEVVARAARHQVVARAAVEQVVAGAAENRVVASAAVDTVGRADAAGGDLADVHHAVGHRNAAGRHRSLEIAAVADQQVVALAAEDQVEAAAAEHDVVAIVAVDDIVAIVGRRQGAEADLVDAVLGEERDRAVVAEQPVVAAAAANGVVAQAADDQVVAETAGQPIVAQPAAHLAAGLRAEHDIVARAGIDEVADVVGNQLQVDEIVALAAVDDDDAVLALAVAQAVSLGAAPVDAELVRPDDDLGIRNALDEDLLAQVAGVAIQPRS